MKRSKKREIHRGPAAEQAQAAAAALRERRTWLLYALGVAAAAVIAVFWAYSPAVHGEFLFDDNVLPFSLPNMSASLADWLRGVRPVLMFTYWINAQLSGEDTFSYHILNVVFHCITSGLVFLIVRRLLEWAHTADRDTSRRNLLAGFAALVFLLHPAQTEAVAYLAGRSEALSVMLVFAAFTVFVYRRQTAVTWPVALAVMALFGAALLAKEHTIALAALLLLTDFWWNPGFSLQGIFRNWKLYLPMALGAAAGIALLWNLILYSPTAGFGFKDVRWYEYLFTQFRGLFVYIGMFALPVKLTADWDFPISRTVLDHGAVFGLAALVGLAVMAWLLRRRFPLAGYGYFVYLVLMAPTSSILPIADPIAERRLYFSMLGLLLIAVDVLSRVKMEDKTLATICLVVALAAASATHARAQVWSGAVPLWEDTAAKSPGKWRAHFQLGFAYYDPRNPDRRCDLAVAEFQKTAQLHTPGFDLLLDWGLAYDCLNQPGPAVEKLRQSAQLQASSQVYSQIGMVYAKNGRYREALDALDTAQQIDPNDPNVWVNRGKVYVLTDRLMEAINAYQRALTLDPNLADARQDLARVGARLRSSVRH